MDSSKGDLTDLLRVEGLPRLVVQVFKEGNNVDRVHEVNECISNVAPIVQVQWQVEKVISAFVQPVDTLQEHFFSVLVGNVPNHDSRSTVFAIEQSIQVDLELGAGRAAALGKLWFVVIGVWLRCRPRVEAARRSLLAERVV